MKISVALATYNGSKYLGTQLESIASQTRPPDELVVSDDRSTDDTLNVVRSFASRVPFEVKIVFNEHAQGVKGNFSTALAHTTGELIFLCDQDDYWFAGKIACISQIHEESRDYWLIVNDVDVTDSKLRSHGVTRRRLLIREGRPADSYVLGCATALTSELVRLAMPISESASGHDRWLSDIATVLERKRTTEQVLQSYRRHETNVSGIDFSDHFGKAQFLRKRLKVHIAEFQASSEGRLVKAEARLAYLVSLDSKAKEICSISGIRPTQRMSILGREIDELSQRVRFLEKRRVWRRASFPKKQFGILKSCACGEYNRHASGLKSVLSDLVGR